MKNNAGLTIVANHAVDFVAKKEEEKKRGEKKKEQFMIRKDLGATTGKWCSFH